MITKNGLKHRAFECLKCGHIETNTVASGPLNNAVGRLSGEFGRALADIHQAIERLTAEGGEVTGPRHLAECRLCANSGRSITAHYANSRQPARVVHSN
jgi:hypothetical protein